MALAEAINALPPLPWVIWSIATHSSSIGNYRLLTTARSTRNIARRPTTSVCLPLQSGSAKTARSGWHQRIEVSTYTARIPRFPDGKNTRRATNACKQIKCNRF